ncbi:hypothetical protein IXO620_15525 [Xanthomonas oryzae pv. oryzae]|nr:hypothetical protein IXO620_15525 [Xanthomonas oryzae pv. oryzae]
MFGVTLSPGDKRSATREFVAVQRGLAPMDVQMTGGTFNVSASMQGASRWMPFARKCLAIDACVLGTGQHMAAVAVGVAFDDECSAHGVAFLSRKRS